MKSLFVSLALGAVFNVNAIEPISATTVGQFMGDCTARPQAEAMGVCYSYIQGALDQIVLRNGNSECLAGLEKREKMIEVWLRLADQAKTPAASEPIWRAVHKAAVSAVPACR